jgi:Mn2+/Fe2+ NRAMP family transporter
MLVALLLNLAGIEPVHFLILAATLTGLSAPILMVIVWFLARDKNLLGEWASGRVSQWLLGIATLAMGSLPIFWLFAG